MDTQQAKDILTGMMTVRGKEIDAIKIAVDMIDEVLQLELAELANTKQTLDSVIEERNRLKEERDTALVQLQSLEITP